MLRLTKILLVLAVAAWGFNGALHNILDWGATLGAVGAVTSMVTIEGGADKWQSVSHPILTWLGALFICGSKILTALLCTAGAFSMWQARKATDLAFGESKRAALAGCGVAMFMLFGGFVVVADGFFEVWNSPVMRDPVLGSAFRYGAMITLIALFVGATDD